MTATTAPLTTTDLLAAVLMGEAIPWTASLPRPSEFLRACSEHSVSALVHERIRALPPECDWPGEIREALAREARAHAANELLQWREVVAVIDALAAEGVFPILLKGTALAYSVYEMPSARPRIDNDLLIRRNEVDRCRRVMAARGYTAPPNSGGELLFCQFPLVRTTTHGVVHRFDVHWKISTQSMFADLLTFDEVSGRAIDVAALGPNARTLGRIDALLLACVHPVMHHRNTESLLWIYDVHLIASALSERDFERFAAMAVDKGVAAICAHQLSAAHVRFGTHIPDTAIGGLTAGRRQEPSAVYLRPNRRWIDEVASSIRGLPQWRDRAKLLREIVLPPPAYMLAAYGLTSSPLVAALLPVLYIHRMLSGGWQVFAGRK